MLPQAVTSDAAIAADASPLMTFTVNLMRGQNIVARAPPAKAGAA
jgi:hypothetical protein